MEILELLIICDAEYVKASKVENMKIPTERWIKARLPDSFCVLLKTITTLLFSPDMV